MVALLDAIVNAQMRTKWLIYIGTDAVLEGANDSGLNIGLE